MDHDGCDHRRGADGGGGGGGGSVGRDFVGHDAVVGAAKVVGEAMVEEGLGY